MTDLTYGFWFNKNLFSKTSLIIEEGEVTKAEVSVNGEPVSGGGEWKEELVWENENPTQAITSGITLIENYEENPYYRIVYKNSIQGELITDFIIDSNTVKAKSLSSETSGVWYNRKLFSSNGKLCVSGHCYPTPGTEDDGTRNIILAVYRIYKEA